MTKHLALGMVFALALNTFSLNAEQANVRRSTKSTTSGYRKIATTVAAIAGLTAGCFYIHGRYVTKNPSVTSVLPQPTDVIPQTNPNTQHPLAEQPVSTNTGTPLGVDSSTNSGVQSQSSTETVPTDSHASDSQEAELVFQPLVAEQNLSTKEESADSLLLLPQWLYDGCSSVWNFVAACRPVRV